VAAESQVRLLLVEDVTQVAQYVRNLLSHQEQVKLLDTLMDGRAVLDQIRELRPDVLMVDALLQGKMSGLEVAERVRQAGLDLPIIILTVPQKPVRAGEGMGIMHVLSMPFSGYDLMSAISRTMATYRAQAPSATSRLFVFHSGKGGVGRTTIAYNAAVALGSTSGLRVVLIDGNLQFGDLRGLLRVPETVPSVLQLPTDRITESDLQAVLWRDPSGIDILLAPPRVEQAEMVTPRDVAKVLSLLRRVYNVIIVDVPTAISDVMLAYLDEADAIIVLITPERTAVRAARLAGSAFIAAGYPATKLVLALNRAGTPGLDLEAMAAELGRAPDHVLPDEPATSAATVSDGVPFVLARPDSPLSRAVTELARDLARRQTRAAGEHAPGADRLVAATR
jgi:pilus assembly protein CpaE